MNPLPGRDPDRLANAMLPVAAAITIAIDEEDAAEIERLLTGLSTQQLYALAVVLAAHVDPDRPMVRRPASAGATKKAARRAALAFGTDIEAVMGDSRRREVLDARAVVYYAAHLLGENYSQIGRVMSRDHSTVMHGYSRVGTTPRLRGIAEQIARDLGWDRDAEEVA